MIEYESNLAFEFDDAYIVSKFDDTDFYRDLFNSMPYSKAVDFVISNEKRIAFIEVKNCTGNEADNRWRIANDNRKVETASHAIDHSDRESLDREMVQKVAMTISALFGAFTCPKPKAKAAKCAELTKMLFADQIYEGNRKIIAILVLNGKFGCQTRSDKTIRLDIQKSVQKKLKWLNCTVIVTDSESFPSSQLGIQVKYQSA